jgi:carbon-monoxide dehydrogenase large subunit
MSIGGSAVSLACDKTIEKAKRIAAHLLESAVDDIDFADGEFAVGGTDRSVTILEVAAAAFRPGAMPADIEPGLYEVGTFAPQYWNWPTGVQVCELEIDPETGETLVVNFVCVDDVGTVVNPMLLKAQMHGGIVQGIGQALVEDIVYDAYGQLITGSLMDYCLPRADDTCNMDIISAPTITQSNLIGAKGGGESGPTGALPATINAVVDALKPLGVNHIDMPATPQRIWQTIQAAKASAA